MYGTCNCYVSWGLQLFHVPPFRPATIEGFNGSPDQLGPNEHAAIREYILRNPRSDSHDDGQVYSPLRSGEIRVLELHPGKFEHDLCGTLHTVSIDFEYQAISLSADPRNHTTWTHRTNHAISLVDKKVVWYTALSYVWGPPQFDVTFNLQDHSEIMITKSLACALRHLRAEEQSVWLWIDQLCINQKDTREKERQIPLMGLVYRHATNTVIWLGEEGDDNPSVAFETLHIVDSRLQFNNQEFTPRDFKRLVLPEADDVAWWEIKQLFRRPWFSRLWVIQEAVLSTNLYIKCGKSAVAWVNFSAWCGTMEISGILRWMMTDIEVDAKHGRGAETGSLLPASGGSIVSNLEKERVLYTSTQGPTGDMHILRVLVSTRYAQSYETKDKVYGVLAIASSNIVPTYSSEVTTRQVYLETCLPLIPKAVFSILCCVDHGTPLRPSWIPDWSVPRRTESLGYSTKSWGLYHAGGQRFPEFAQAISFDFQLSDKRSVLTLPGKIVDTVSTLGPVSSNAFLSIDDPAHENGHLTANVDIAGSRQSYPSGCTVYDAFWHTLVAGKDDSGNARAPPEYSEVFSLVLDSSTGNMPSLPGQTYSPRRKKGFFTLDSLRSRNPQKILKEMQQAIVAALQYRRFATTDRGYFALVPRGTRLGDRICVFERGHVPFVIRPVEGGEGYELMGECYVHGIMQGEVMEMKDIPLQPVRLV
ncbi:HET-domain-containing protein [Melanomma pulvis-pyrius CBS 109.77]|uniref:HET-domain-containing protein n=1 Tax=Melanomma pulvis-pyrius CBS 109.77 TaxID=1314802 RepID=A0A6A6X795_9PLEO|nr:HET-domain-containing protein [Melanomma pulvis-pyrius CBS 109.77]